MKFTKLENDFYVSNNGDVLRTDGKHIFAIYFNEFVISDFMSEEVANKKLFDYVKKLDPTYL